MANSLARDWVLLGMALDFTGLGMVLVNSLVYFTIGLLVLRKAILVAKRRNLIGQY